MNNIEIIIDKTKLSTLGLKPQIGHEIQLLSFGSTEPEKDLISFLITYVFRENAVLRDEETVSYGLWLLKLVLKNDILHLYELDPSFKEWIEGAENAVYYYEQQSQLCKSENTELNIPLFTQNIAISKGVFDGLDVQGIRYLEPSHMSGWYLTTKEYDNDIKKMSVVSLQELVINRKDLLQFLGLPVGYVFETLPGNKCNIWQLPDIAHDISGN